MGKAKLTHLPIFARPGFISVHGSPFLKQGTNKASTFHSTCAFIIYRSAP